jgi:poly(A) polymerase
LLFRYGASGSGTIEKKAHIYTQEEHGIDLRLVDPDAVWIVRRLRGARFHAYIVGGAVRDLIVGRVPKDFDIATDAHPMQIRRLFRSARVIGRRFRLVHVYCSREKYIEVSTFRSKVAPATTGELAHPDANNFFGTIEEDAERRDFTINALYYCPVDQQLLDYVDALPDLRQRRLRTLNRAESSFEEDPVRMIRAVKYAALLDFPFPHPLTVLVRRMRESVLTCSRERVTEEVHKILASGSSLAILELASKLRLFEVIFPAHAAQLRTLRGRLSGSPFGIRLQELDHRTAEGSPLPRGDMFGFLFLDLALEKREMLDSPEPELSIQQFIRNASAPLFPSKKDLALAAEMVLRTAHPQDHPRGSRRPGGHGPSGHAAPGRGPSAGANGEQSETGGRKKRRRRGRRRGGSRGPGGSAPQSPPQGG